MTLPLASIFDGNTAYLNQEITVPACVIEEALYINPILENHPELLQEVREMLRVIIHPNVKSIQSRTKRYTEKILESPYECGRVLESPNKVVVNGISYNLNVKGVGVTRFYRETQANNPWHSAGMDPEIKRALDMRTFFEDRGVFHKQDALENMEWFHRLQTFGVETEIPLAIYELTSLPDENGEMQSIEFLKKKWYLHKDVEPVLYIRMSRTNFRFLDPIRMNETEKFRPLIQPLFTHALSEYRNMTKNEHATIQEYAEWVIQKIISQEIHLTMNGIYHGWETWPDFGRILSLFGEIIDLDDVKNYSKLEAQSFYDFEEFFGRKIDLLVSNIRQFINAFVENGIEIDIPSIAQIFIDTIYATCLKNTTREHIQNDEMYQKILKNPHKKYLRKLAHQVQNYIWCDHKKNTLQNDMKEYLEKEYNW